MSTGYGWEGIRQVCATLLGVRHVPEHLCGRACLQMGAITSVWPSSLPMNSSVKCCSTDDLMLNVPMCCLAPSRVDCEVHRLKVIIDCPQPGSSRATYRPPPISRWSKCGSNDTVMVFPGSGTSKVSKETQPNTGKNDWRVKIKGGN